MREVLSELTAALTRRLPCVYCAVVETKGSTPQKAGAAMLVYSDGTQAGTLGGGCVEAEVKRQALLSLNGSGRPEVFSFTLDDDYGWDDGLICGGRMTILAQPLLAETTFFESARHYYHRLHDLVQSGEGFTEAVVISGAAGLPIGDRYLFDATGGAIAHLADQPAAAAVSENIPLLSSRPAAVTKQGVAYLPALPRFTIFLVGGGHVGQAVAKLAADVGFDIWVLDDRDRFVSPERFPTASKRLVGDIGSVLKDRRPDAQAFDLRCDPDPRPQSRRRSALSPSDDRVRLRRHDRQQAQDSDDLRRSGGEGNSCRGAVTSACAARLQHRLTDGARNRGEYCRGANRLSQHGGQRNRPLKLGTQIEQREVRLPQRLLKPIKSPPQRHEDHTKTQGRMVFFVPLGWALPTQSGM